MESSSCKYLYRHRTNPLLPPHYMCYCHHIIIDHDCSMIRRVDSIRLEENCIVNLICIELDTTANKIIKYQDFIFWCFESNSEFFSIRYSFLRFFKRKMTTVSIVSCWELKIFLFLSERSEAFTGTETVVCTSLFTEFMEFFLIYMRPFTLGIRTKTTIMMWTLIWTYPNECKCLNNLINRILNETSSISILDTNDKFSIVMPCPEIRIERSTQVTDMNISSWRWSKTGTNSHTKIGDNMVCNISKTLKKARNPSQRNH